MASTARKALLLRSALCILTHREHEIYGATSINVPGGCLTRAHGCGILDADVKKASTQPSTEIGNKMAKKPNKSHAAEVIDATADIFGVADEKAQPGYVASQVDESEFTVTENPVEDRAPTKQELMAEKAQAKIKAKADKAQAKIDTAIAKAEAQAGKVTATAEERAAKKAEREARIAALDPEGKRTHTGSMLALADKVKEGAYSVGATGQLRSNNDLAMALDAVPVGSVIQLAKRVLGLDENPYSHLNTGQQSMNLRNKMRGAITKGTLTLEQIKGVIAEEGYATAGDWAANKAKKTAEKAARVAEAKAEKAAKAAAKAEEAVAA